MIIAVTQRVEVIEAYKERRDELDQRWAVLLQQFGMIPLLIPNQADVAKKMLESLPIDGILLTGGGDLECYGGTAPERDAVEKLLLEHAILNLKPVLGVCRGMQAIQDYFGVPLQKISNHVAASHKIYFEGRPFVVNSYHAWGTDETVQELTVLARSDDGIVEAIKHTRYPIEGVMWHPERASSLTPLDFEIISAVFKRRP